MNKKEAKLVALRTATALINAGVYFHDEYSEAENAKIVHEMESISFLLYKKAVKIGGDFNQFTGESL